MHCLDWLCPCLDLQVLCSIVWFIHCNNENWPISKLVSRERKWNSNQVHCLVEKLINWSFYSQCLLSSSKFWYRNSYTKSRALYFLHRDHALPPLLQTKILGSLLCRMIFVSVRYMYSLKMVLGWLCIVNVYQTSSTCCFVCKQKMLLV